MRSKFKQGAIMKAFKLLLPALALAVAGVAGAASRGEAPSTLVRYDDLNLNSKAGVAKLHSRIRGAAEIVCVSLDSRALGLREYYDRCITDAVAHAVAAVDNDNLTDYHQKTHFIGRQVVARN
jgi:UrcA family protein